VPQFHVMAWGFPYSCLFVGANLVMPGPHMTPTALAQLLADEKVTVANGVPTIWTGVYQELKANPRDISSVRALVIGGSALPKAMIRGFQQDFGVNTLHAWGMTEMSPVGTTGRLKPSMLTLPRDAQIARKQKQGRPVYGVDAKIVGENGDALARDGIAFGELLVRGPWIIGSYFKDEEASQAAFDADGWFRTGDVATIDSESWMQIVDRSKDVIKSGGEWISSIDLENEIMAHPEVAEATVVGLKHVKWQERPVAFVVRIEGSTVTADDLIAFVTDRVAKWWIPDEIVFVDEIPKTGTGKFDKKVVREKYADLLTGGPVDR